jgi:hypothetical protein
MARIQFYRLDDFSGANLERVYAFIDRVHDAAAEGHLVELTNWSSVELIQWLTEIGFTLEETIREIQAADARVQTAIESAVLE